MADIKTRDAVKGAIKTIDKAAVASAHMKAAYAKTKDKAEQGYYADENSATEYAADKVSGAAERVTHEGIHQFDKQGRKGVKETRENIGKAKDKISDFKQKRAAKAAEQRVARSGQFGSPVRPTAASRTSDTAAQTVKTESKTETQITETDDGHGNIVQTETTVTSTYLYIVVSHKTAEEMVDKYGFNAEQRQMLAELLAEENNSLWSQLLYGISYGDGEIVSVALSQLGNVGGQPYWS